MGVLKASWGALAAKELQFEHEKQSSWSRCWDGLGMGLDGFGMVLFFFRILLYKGSFQRGAPIFALLGAYIFERKARSLGGVLEVF